MNIFQFFGKKPGPESTPETQPSNPPDNALQDAEFPGGDQDYSPGMEFPYYETIYSPDPCSEDVAPQPNCPVSKIWGAATAWARRHREGVDYEFFSDSVGASGCILF